LWLTRNNAAAVAERRNKPKEPSRGSMARKRKLRPGKGAKAIILTRFIKPNQPLPDNNRDHRSNLVLVERVKDAKAKDIYKFRYDIDAEEEAGNFLSANVHHVLSANVRYVKVTMEGDSNDLFDGPGEPLPEPFKEPKKSGEIPVHDDFSMTMSKMELFNLAGTTISR
jgi:hypothetical protein